MWVGYMDGGRGCENVLKWGLGKDAGVGFEMWDGLHSLPTSK